MKIRVICVSRSLAAGGEEIGRALSLRMGFRYADEEIVAMVAEREGVDVELVQDAERRQTFIERMLKSFTVVPASEITGARAALLGTEYFRELIRCVVEDTAREGNVVIVAHAAAMALAGEEGILRVLVTASPEVRAARLAAACGIAADEAATAIKDSDKSRRDYLKAFYGVNEELPVHYDIVINTDVLALDRAVEAIVAAAER